ncbi:Sodium/calcium antiporter [Mycetohabitans rhizoxinica HKI 454]|uniref:Sodium/calcium antiporter n=1 Tax=Mycetohabitans rhizoxinica (strain DSM 19002 / CIP 109453 / HKI 454) TaxID=882378 RepID=E5AKD6_MYCRK|nr:Sodium/calcium antiporter [Mycetohabitans rhizoxinica HKI 454]
MRAAACRLECAGLWGVAFPALPGRGCDAAAGLSGRAASVRRQHARKIAPTVSGSCRGALGPRGFGQTIDAAPRPGRTVAPRHGSCVRPWRYRAPSPFPLPACPFGHAARCDGSVRMTWLVLELMLMLAVILVAAELFTNALEHLGERMKLSEGVTGSLFAAVGTALPETLIPLIAIVSGRGERLNEEIGVGAILGAPLMLATLSTCLMTVAVLRQRGLCGRIRPEVGGINRDLNYFLFAFALSAAAMYVPHTSVLVRAGLSAALVCVYLCYVYATLRASQALVAGGHGTEAPHVMYLSRFGIPTRLRDDRAAAGHRAGLVNRRCEGIH